MSWLERSKPNEKEIIWNSKLEYIYNHSFKDETGKFFQVVFVDKKSAEVQISARTMLKVAYIKSKDNIDSFEIIKSVKGREPESVKLNNFNLAQLKAFMELISSIDLKGISQNRLKLFDGEELDNETIKRIKALLSSDEGIKIIETLIEEGIITSKDIVNTSYRKRGLQIYQKMLADNVYWKLYAEEYNISKQSEEKVWQYFFEKNQWIFGYGLDYRYKNVVQREANLSNAELDGSNTVITDFLMADKNFTSFIELKKPSTPLFKSTKNRSNSWRLSNELIEAVSQILEQKASGEIWLDKQRYNFEGEPVQQKAYDSNVILIIGSWSELKNNDSTQEKEIKRKTFELFRRNNRNIEILTFDELYERAQYIALGENEKTKDTNYGNLIVEEEDYNPFDSDEDDLPF